MGRESTAAATGLTQLIDAWLADDVTAFETGCRIDRLVRRDASAPSAPEAALRRLFPPYPADEPDADVVRLLRQALAMDEYAAESVTALAERRALLEAVITLAPGDDVADVILRPGERILLGTIGGRNALTSLLAGNPHPFVDWLGRTVVDDDAFTSTTSDVPLHDLGNLHELIVRLADATEGLTPGRLRVMVADEWVAETTVAALDDAVPFADVARAIGEALLDRDAPILLWHAAHELALVTEDDPDLRTRVLDRCLEVGDAEDGRCPAEAAARLLFELSPTGAIRTLDAVAPRLDAAAWRAIGRGFLRSAIATQWHEWRETVQRWAGEDDVRRALTAFDALVRAPVVEPGALAWFTDSPVEGVRLACRGRLGLEA